MLPVRLAIIILALFSLTFWTAPSSFAQQRRVFTNDDLPQPPPPPAPAEAAPTTGDATAPPAETAPPTEPTPFDIEYPKPDPKLPPALRLANFLQTTLQKSLTGYTAQFDAQIDSARQERFQTILNLTVQLITFNQSFIADLEAQQKEAEAETQAQGGAQPATAP